MIFYCGHYGTTRLARMLAISKLTLFGNLEYFGKIMRHLGGIEIYGSEAAYTGYVDKLSHPAVKPSRRK